MHKSELMYNGLKVIVRDDSMTCYQKVELKSGICSEDFTAEFNEWLLERFGMSYTAYRIFDTLVMHSAVVAKLKLHSN